MNQKNIKFIVTIIIVPIGVLILSYLQFFNPQKETKNPKSVHNTKVEIKGNGDNVNRDKVTNNTTINIQKPESKAIPVSAQKLVEAKEKPVINNSIVNQASNYGTQTVNNYNNEKSPRSLNDADLNYLKNTIPSHYMVIIEYITATEETINYANQVILTLQGMGYKVSITQMGMQINGVPYSTGERIKFVSKDEVSKTITFIIREQK